MTTLSVFCKTVLCLLLCFSICSNASGQLEILGFHFKNPKQKQWKIPFQQYNNLIVIQLTVNSLYDTLNFVVDTGVGYTLITDPSVREKLGLTCIRTLKISGFGKDEPLSACVVKTAFLGIGKRVVAYNQHVVILERDILELSRYAGVRIHGLLGYELFSRFVVKIDYQMQQITLTKPDVFKPTIKKNTQILPISIEEMKPYLQTEVAMKNDSTQIANLKLLLDTGAGHSLSLDMGTHPAIALPPKYLPAQLGMTLNGAVDGIIGRVKSLKIGTLDLKDVITTFPDSISVANRVSLGSTARQGNIGCGILSRFQITFDYRHKKLYIRPNRHFKAPFEFSTSGIELTAVPPYYTQIKVGGVRPNSPADRIGMRVGDRIVAVDDRLTHDLKLGEIYKLINRAAGKRVSILVELAEGGLQVVELLLENPL